MRLTALVLVHHRNFPGVCETLNDLLSAGIEAENALVVDNSEDVTTASALMDMLPTGVQLLTSPNRGYGAAVNLGVEALRRRQTAYDSVLVATHEVRPDFSSIKFLANALDDTSVQAAGPTLLIDSDQGVAYWSTGGYLTRCNEPRHHSMGEPYLGYAAHRQGQAAIAERAFVDGAFCLYRWTVFDRLRMPEEYFLYFEEVDFHCRIRSELGQVVWVRSSIVRQKSSGIPPYFFGRNLQLFQRRHGTRLQRIFTTPSAIMRELVRIVVGKQTIRNVAAMVRGWREALRS